MIKDIQTKRILKEMCKRVKANYKKIDFKKEGWYAKYNWTEQQQEDFGLWLVKELNDKAEVRKAIMRHPIKNKYLIERTASNFILAYGWKLKDKKQNNKKK